MTVLLNRSYMGLVAGTTVGLATNAESSLIAQGLASTALKANITPGNVTANVGWALLGCAIVVAIFLPLSVRSYSRKM